MPLNISDLKNHIQEICDENNISIGSHSRGGRASKRHRWIKIRPVKSFITYAIALHELGHVLGKMQSGIRLDQEAGAWVWARKNALQWTPVMTKTMKRCLQSYVMWSRRSLRAKTVDDDPDHKIWMLLGVDD